MQKLVERFRSIILARGRTAKHADDTAKRVERVLQDAAITNLHDLRATQVEIALGRLKQRASLSPVTINHHLRAIKSFSRFLMLDGVAPADPLARLRPLNAGRDRRHRRRALSLHEIRSLLSTAHAGPVVRGMSGPARHALYLLALTSGLRSSELRALKVRDLVRNEAGDWVRLDGKWTKNGEDANLPIPAMTAQAIQTAIQGRRRLETMFAMPQCTRVVMMLRKDLAAAGIEYLNDRQEYADFHSLRHTFLTHLAKLTNNLTTVQAMARHSTITLTIDRYCHADASEQRECVDSLGRHLAGQWAEPGSNRRHMDFQSMPAWAGDRNSLKAGKFHNFQTCATDGRDAAAVFAARVCHGGHFMLVLSRRVNQRVILTVPPSSGPTQIEVCLNSISFGEFPGGTLGFVAPSQVVILREEVLDKFNKESHATLTAQTAAHPTRRAV